MDIIILGAVMTATLLVTLRRVMPWATVRQYANVIDVSFTVILLLIFHGTISGAAGATVAGLMLATVLTLARWLFGYRRGALRRSGLSVGWTWEEQPGVINRAAAVIRRVLSGYQSRIRAQDAQCGNNV